jgi:hypothetical protein
VWKDDREAMAGKHLFAEVIRGGFYSRLDAKRAGGAMQHEDEREGPQPLWLVNFNDNLMALNNRCSLAVPICTLRARVAYAGKNRGENYQKQTEIAE